jgi:hypothetical protein
MDTHGMSLLQNNCPDEIYSLVRLQHLAERIAQLYKSKADTPFDVTSDLNIQIFLNEIQEWRARTPPEIRNLRTVHHPRERIITDFFSSAHVAIAEPFVTLTIFSHELGFLELPYSSHRALSSPQSHLTSCLSAAKTFFEALLAVPETVYAHFSVVQYAMVIQAILVLTRLTFLMAAALNWDAGTARSTIPLVMYLDALSYRFHALSPTPAPASGTGMPKQSDALYVFAMVLGSVKRSYIRRVSNIQRATVVGDRTVVARGPHCPMKDPSLSTYLEHDLNSAYSSSLDDADMTPSVFRAMHTPVYHDLWATMTCSWANDA